MDDKEFGAINFIPFVDIMLVLLTIVLTTSTFIARGYIPMELPRASKQEKELIRSQIIEISKEGQIFFNGTQEKLENLPRRIEHFSREIPILIRADSRIALQSFVDIMDIVKNIGFKRVSLQTELKK